MRWACGAHVTRYDLGGVGVASIDKFKASLGGTPARHHRWVYASWPVRRAATLAQRLARSGLIRLHR
jgi:hypothetical protein